MSPCPSMLLLSPSACLHFLCLLLLLTGSTSTVPKKSVDPAEPLTQLNTTQGDDGHVAENATDLQLKKHSEGTQGNQFLPNSSSPVNHTSVSDTFNYSTVTPTPGGGKPPSTAPPSIQQLDHELQPPETVTQPAALPPSPTTGSPTQAVQTESITSTGTIASTTTQHVNTTTSLVNPTTTKTPKPTTTVTPMFTTTIPIPTSTTAAAAAAAAAEPATSVSATTTPTKATKAVTSTTTGREMTPPPQPPPPSPPPADTPQPNVTSTGMPPVPTPAPRGPTTLTSATTSTPANHNNPVASGTRVAMVDVAGDALTKQLVDTASLLAVLLFGLLFFLVTVAVFVKQAYESYRRKDYTQVDYLINGMYTDSGV